MSNADDGSVRISKESRWLLGLAGTCLLLFGGFLGRAFELGATYATKQEVSLQITDQVEQVRREIALASETAKANAETLRAEMRGGFETMKAQIDALRAEQRIPDGR